jgi:hypothetical protein
MNIVANGLNSLPSTLDVSKQRPSEIAHLLGVAIAATNEINDSFIGQEIDFELLSLGLAAVRQTTVGDDKTVVNFSTGRAEQPISCRDCQRRPRNHARRRWGRT